jgi:hypothetical protein
VGIFGIVVSPYASYLLRLRIRIAYFSIAFEMATWLTGMAQGGITNGHEMVAAYIRENFPGPAAEAALAMADVGDKGSEYTNSRSGETFWWLWQILKAMTVGNGKSKKLSKLV